MYRLKTFRTSAWIISLLLLLAACRKKDADLKEMDNLVNFEVASQGIAESENSIQVKLKLSRAVTSNVGITVNATLQGLQYGTQFTTIPEMQSGTLNLIIPSGNNEAVITISKVPGPAFNGNENIRLDIYSAENPVIIGSNRQYSLTFSEQVATSGNATIDGGGQYYTNKVFIDLSANRSVGVNRNTWDLGFYSGADFRVTLNSSMAMMAKQINKNDLTQVTAADTIGFSEDVYFNGTAPTVTSTSYIDYPNGDLTRTAIAEISANAADNKVYIVNRGVMSGATPVDRGWKKIRIIRNNAGGYTLQHADIASTTFQEVQISKDPNYFFKYASFETGAVNVEPAAMKWDIAWTYFANVANFGAGDVPYLYQDIIVQNRNVEVARVMTSTVNYDAFNETNLAGLSFSGSQIAIGADWRSGGGPGVSPAVRTDRFYIVKDGDGNIYKLRFTGLTNSSNERGYPSYEMVLVKKG